MSRNNKLFNYLVNTFKVDRETVLSAIHIRVDDLVKKHIDHKMTSDWVERLIVKYVAQYIENGKLDEHYLTRETFTSIVDNHVKDIVYKRLDQAFEINLIVKRKDEKIIKVKKV